MQKEVVGRKRFIKAGAVLRLDSAEKRKNLYFGDVFKMLQWVF